MIELTNINATDTVGQLRGQINTMQNEIMADQPMIGRCRNPTVNLYDEDNILVGTITAETMIDCHLSAIIFPENNGCFVADIIGHCHWSGRGPDAMPNVAFTKLVIDVPSIKSPNGTIYTNFLTPRHMWGLEASANTFYIGVNSTLCISDQNRDITTTHPFAQAYIETSENEPSTLNIIAKSEPLEITVPTTGTLYLNF